MALGRVSVSVSLATVTRSVMATDEGAPAPRRSLVLTQRDAADQSKLAAAPVRMDAPDGKVFVTVSTPEGVKLALANTADVAARKVAAAKQAGAAVTNIDVEVVSNALDDAAILALHANDNFDEVPTISE